MLYVQLMDRHAVPRLFSALSYMGTSYTPQVLAPPLNHTNEYYSHFTSSDRASEKKTFEGKYCDLQHFFVEVFKP